MEIIKPNIYNHKILSEYLKEFHLYKKKLNSRWSLGLWSKKLELKGTGTLSNFISGRRIPEEKTLNRIKSFIGFSEYESQYFDALVIVSSKNSNESLKAIAKNFLDQKSEGKNYLEISEDEFRLISSPLTMILIEASKLKNFKKTTQWVKENLKLLKTTNDEIEKTFKIIENFNLLKKDKSLYKTPKDINSDVLKDYYENCLKLNSRAIREIPKDDRFLNSITFCCNKENLDSLKNLIHNFSQNSLQLFDEKSGDTVYQLHIQLVPHI